jgi:hypothetical protein
VSDVLAMLQGASSVQAAATASDAPEAAVNWEISHTECGGREVVLMDMESDPDDAGGESVVVRGRGRQALAEQLVLLLNGAAVVGVSAAA